MLEDVQEALQCPVARAQALSNQLGVVVGQDPQRTDQPHEVDTQPRRAIARQLERFDLARREGDGRVRGKVGHLVGRCSEPADACPPDSYAPHDGQSNPYDGDFTKTGFRVPFIVVSPYAKAHYISHTVRDLNVLYVCGPGHGGPGIVANVYLEGTYTEYYPKITQDAEGMQKLFRPVYSPRNRSSTLANKYTLPPAN